MTLHKAILIALVALFVVSLAAIGVANVMVVNYCQAVGGVAVTPFLTTQCEGVR